MTEQQKRLARSEAQNYSDPDAFVSDMLTSSAFLPEDESAEIDLTPIDDLRKIWTTVCAPFRTLLGEIGMTQTKCAERFGIPFRTVQHWALGERPCPIYVRWMIAEIANYI